MFQIFLQLWLSIACTFNVNFCAAQSNLLIKSIEEHRPLAYASVANLTNGQMHFSDEQGRVAGNFEAGDSVFITYVGYQSIKARIENTCQTFFLKQSALTLEPVKIVNCKDVIKHEYSNFNSDNSSNKFGGVGSWTKGAMNNKGAILFKPGIEQARLHSFSIWLERGYREIKYKLPKVAINAPLIFSFYSVNDSTELPGELITGQQIIYHPKKDGKQIISIDSLCIMVPKEGIYIAFQYVYNEKYLYPQRFIDKQKGIDSIYMAYGARIDGVYTKECPLSFFDFKSNTWVFPMFRDKSIRHKPHGTIKFSAELSTCKPK